MSHKTIRPDRTLSRRELEAFAAGLENQLAIAQEQLEIIAGAANTALDEIAPEDEPDYDPLEETREAIRTLCEQCIDDPEAPTSEEIDEEIENIVSKLPAPDEAPNEDDLTGMVLRTLETFAAIKLAGAPFQFDYQELARAIARQLAGEGQGPTIDV